MRQRRENFDQKGKEKVERTISCALEHTLTEKSGITSPDTQDDCHWRRLGDEEEHC